MSQAPGPVQTPPAGSFLDALTRGVPLSDAIKKAVANAGWLAVNHLLILGVSMVVGFWVARYLGPTRLGQLSFALAIYTVALPLAHLGAQHITMRELVRRPADSAVLLGSALGIRLAVALPCAALMVLVAWLCRPTDGISVSLTVVVAAAVIPLALNVFEFYFNSRVEARFAVGARLVALAAASASRLAAVLLRAPVAVFAAVFTASVLVEMLVAAAIYERRGGRISAWRFDRAQAAALLRDCWPYIFADLALMVYLRIDQVLIGLKLGDQQLGLYAAAATLAESFNFLSAAITMSAFPGLCELRQHNPALYERRMRQFYAVMTWLPIACALAISLAAPLIIRAAYGPSFGPSAPILAILVWATVLLFQTMAQNAWTLAENLQRCTAVAQVIGAVLNVGLNLLWIPRLGIAGAAWATMVSYAAALLLPGLFFPSARPSLWRLLWALVAPWDWLVGLIRRGRAQDTL